MMSLLPVYWSFSQLNRSFFFFLINSDLELFSSTSNPLYVFSAATYLFPSHNCELKVWCLFFFFLFTDLSLNSTEVSLFHLDQQRPKVIQLCLKFSVRIRSSNVFVSFSQLRISSMCLFLFFLFTDLSLNFALFSCFIESTL